MTLFLGERNMYSLKEMIFLANAKEILKKYFSDLKYAFYFE